MMAGPLPATQPEFFLTLANLTNILKQNAIAALLALGMFVVIVTAGIDLSVGSMHGACHGVRWRIANAAGVPWPIVHPDRAAGRHRLRAGQRPRPDRAASCRIPSS